MISVIISTKNEEENIESLLKSLVWCDEIIIVDDFSEDKTVEIARKFTSKIFIRKLNNDFSEQRNFGLSKAKYDWVLFVDADEKVSDNLKHEILNVIQAGKFDGYFIKRKDFIWGKEIKHGEFGSNCLLRLAKKNKGKWVGKVHEKWDVRGEIGKLENPILHYPHENIRSFLKKVNFYTDIRAQELLDEGVRVSFLSIILYTKAKFVQNYFFKFGFLDGIPGLVLAILMSFHSFLTRGKLWNLWQRK